MFSFVADMDGKMIHVEFSYIRRPQRLSALFKKDSFKCPGKLHVIFHS